MPLSLDEEEDDRLLLEEELLLFEDEELLLERTVERDELLLDLDRLTEEDRPFDDEEDRPTDDELLLPLERLVPVPTTCL